MYLAASKSLVIHLCLAFLPVTGEGDSIQASLLPMTGSRTVPQLFINGKYIGGNSGECFAFSSLLHTCRTPDPKVHLAVQVLITPDPLKCTKCVCCGSVLSVSCAEETLQG